MARITIKVNQQLDRCGEEFLAERDFVIELDIEPGENEWTACSIDGHHDCFIKTADLKQVAALLNC